MSVPAVDRVLPDATVEPAAGTHPCVAPAAGSGLATCEAIPTAGRGRWSEPRMCGASTKHVVMAGTYGEPVDRALCEMYHRTWLRAWGRNSIAELVKLWGWQ